MRPAVLVLRPDDAARIATLHHAANGDGWPVQDYRNMLGEPQYLALGIANEQDDTLAAFALCQTVLDTADLLMVATHPNSRRRGYARTLLRTLLSRLGERGTARLTLDVAADNDAAIALYNSLEFAEDGRRPNYYKRNGQRIDAVLMSRAVAGLPRSEKA